MARREFSDKTRRLAFERSGGFCECEIYCDTERPVDIRRPRHGVPVRRCGLPLQARRMRFDHRDPDAAGGGNDLDNCQVICLTCDAWKTNKQDAPALARQRSISDKVMYDRAPKSPPMPGSRRSKWKRKMNGSVVRRE